MASFRIVEVEGSALWLEVRTSDSLLEIITNVRLDSETLVLYDFHVDGPGAHALGLGEIRRLVQRAMDAYDVTQLEIHGFRRSTGANPGRKLRALRFVRR